MNHGFEAGYDVPAPNGGAAKYERQKREGKNVIPDEKRHTLWRDAELGTGRRQGWVREVLIATDQESDQEQEYCEVMSGVFPFVAMRKGDSEGFDPIKRRIAAALQLTEQAVDLRKLVLQIGRIQHRAELVVPTAAPMRSRICGLILCDAVRITAWPLALIGRLRRQ